ncbi:MAG: hypothetical protein HYV75_00735 [Opitutae bacterium]|nr:hypothetical protein [Opitutae bacterium]
MPSVPPPTPLSSRPALVLAGLSLFAAAAWLVTRVWVGVDFTDEMQYYGQIASLARTGRFFQTDLFLQQLGYVFLHPFFKVHALLFPDQDYLVLFGRLLLLAAYAGTGALFWRAATRLGGFSTAQKLAGLAAFAAWIPFQIFAFSYNTTAYLLIVLLLSVWLTRDPARYTRYLVLTAGLLTLLTYTHPMAGLSLLAAAAVETAVRRDLRTAAALLGTTALFGLVVLGLMFCLHGRDFFTDLLAGINFTRSWSFGAAIMQPYHFSGWLILIGLGALAVLRLQLGRACRLPLGQGSPAALRWSALVLLVALGGMLLGRALAWTMGYFAVCALLGVLMLLAVSIGPPADRSNPPPRHDALLRRIMTGLVLGGIVILLTMMLTTHASVTGYFAITVYGVLLLLLVMVAGSEDRPATTGLVVVGTVGGAVVGFTSGNGLSSFGIGAAAVIPFLILHCARRLQQAGAPGAVLVGPGLALLLLCNGIATPYLEQSIRADFHPVRGVPAFRGIWTSPEKIEAIEKFLPLTAHGALRNRRVLVVGPHPWLYFVLGGEPATSILFMKFDGAATVYEQAAARLFRAGPPDVIVLTAVLLPPPFAALYQGWAREPHQTATLPVSADFNHRFQLQTNFGFNPEVYVLSRPPRHP